MYKVILKLDNFFLRYEGEEGKGWGQIDLHLNPPGETTFKMPFFLELRRCFVFASGMFCSVSFFFFASQFTWVTFKRIFNTMITYLQHITVAKGVRSLVEVTFLSILMKITFLTFDYIFFTFISLGLLLSKFMYWIFNSRKKGTVENHTPVRMTVGLKYDRVSSRKWKGKKKNITSKESRLSIYVTKIL